MKCRSCLCSHVTDLFGTQCFCSAPRMLLLFPPVGTPRAPASIFGTPCAPFPHGERYHLNRSAPCSGDRFPRHTRGRHQDPARRIRGRHQDQARRRPWVRPAPCRVYPVTTGRLRNSIPRLNTTTQHHNSIPRLNTKSLNPQNEGEASSAMLSLQI